MSNSKGRLVKLAKILKKGGSFLFQTLTVTKVEPNKVELVVKIAQKWNLPLPLLLQYGTGEYSGTFLYAYKVNSYHSYYCIFVYFTGNNSLKFKKFFPRI